MFGPLLIGIAAALFGGRKTPKEERERRELISYARSNPKGFLLTLVVFLLFCGLLASLLLSGHPVSVDSLVRLFFFGKIAFLSVIVAVILLALHLRRASSDADDNRPRFGWPAKTLILVALLAGGMLLAERRYAKPESLAATTVETRAAETQPAVANDAEADREALIEKVDRLRAQAIRRWRADIVAAGLTGPPGVVPPMIEVTEQASGLWSIRNRSAHPVCVNVRRVIGNAPGTWSRCALDELNDCHSLGPGQSTRVALAASTRAGCTNAKLEYRVGHALNPEPTWWTSTALTAFDETPDPVDRAHRRWTADHLRAEISLLEQMLSEPDRAARWRQETWSQ